MNFTDQVVELLSDAADNFTDYYDFQTNWTTNSTELLEPKDNNPNWFDILDRYLYHIITIQLFFGFPLNIFHFAVLTRKEMRSNVVFRMMIGISLCDFCTHITTFLTFSPFFIRSPLTAEEECFSTQNYFDVMMDYIAVPIMDTSQRTSSWLALFMALFRTLSVMFPLSARMQKLAKPQVVLYAFTICVAITVLTAAPVFLPFNVYVNTTEETCDGILFNLTEPRYSRRVPKELLSFQTKMVTVYGLSKALPALLDAILAILLILELSKAKKRRNALNKADDEQFNNTTKLILFMTISFLILEVPNGIGHIYYGLFVPSGTAFMILNAILDAAELFPVLNCASHVFVCYLLTAQYRETVRGMLGIAKSVKNITVVAKTSAVSNS